MLRRGTAIFALVIALLLGGMIALGVGVDAVFHAQQQFSTNELTALALFFLAAVGGLIGQVSIRLSARHLTQQVKASVADNVLARVDRTHPDLSTLADAINEVIDTAEQVVARSKLAVKELEIQ